MKNPIKILVSLLLVILSIYACNLNSDYIKEDNLMSDEFNFNKIALLYNELNPIKTESIYLGNMSGILQQTAYDKKTLQNIPNLEVKKYSMILSNDKDLNDKLGVQNTKKIISINFYSENNQINGIAIYYLFNNNMFVNLFTVENKNFVKIKNFPKIVNDVIFQDVNYIGSQYFNGKDILSHITKYT